MAIEESRGDLKCNKPKVSFFKVKRLDQGWSKVKLATKGSLKCNSLIYFCVVSVYIMACSKVETDIRFLVNTLRFGPFTTIKDNENSKPFTYQNKLFIMFPILMQEIIFYEANNQR